MTWRIAWLAALMGCGGVPEEICGNKLDDDGNGVADCADEACFDATCIEICDDLQDNNKDGLPDCADPQCDGQCPEICDDGRDNDWNGSVDCNDDACQPECDVDQDGFARLSGGGDDCDDNDPLVNPAAPEVCDEIDNNCNGLIDREDPDIERSEVSLYYLDADGDGYGDPANALYECSVPPGRADNGDDCDDEDPATNPDTPEICNGLDDNCDGLIDDQDPAVDMSTASTWYVDADGDGLGIAGYSLQACNRPVGYADNTDDCDDTSSAILGESNWVEDLDGDGYGSGAPIGPFGCATPGANFYPDYAPTDCDEGNASIYPGAYEFCGDGLDWDCDGADCLEWGDDFESGTIGNQWTNGGNAIWLAQAAMVYEGAYAAESGNIGDAQESWIRATVDFPIGGDVSFWHTGDTEAGWDFLEFRIDGTLTFSRAGNWAWEQASFPVAPGLHTFEWKYRKDGSLSAGADTVWVDDIQMPGSSG